jgi:hypothetical protein
MHSNKLGKKRIKKIIELKKQGKTDSEICRELKISKKTLTIFLGGNKIGFNGKHEISETSTGNDEADQGDRSRDTKLPGSENRGKPVDNKLPDNVAGDVAGTEKNGSCGSDDKLSFVGGKKDMKNKETSENSNDDDDDNTCGACSSNFNGKPKHCPNCGAELDYENSK